MNRIINGDLLLKVPAFCNVGTFTVGVTTLVDTVVLGGFVVVLVIVEVMSREEEPSIGRV